MSPGAVVEIVALLIPITAILVTGGVILLRPLTSRLGLLLEAITHEKRGTAPTAKELSEIRQHVSTLESRLALLEERQGFAEALLSSKQNEKALSAAGARTVATPGAPE